MSTADGRGVRLAGDGAIGGGYTGLTSMQVVGEFLSRKRFPLHCRTRFRLVPGFHVRPVAGNRGDQFVFWILRLAPPPSAATGTLTTPTTAAFSPARTTRR